MKKVGVIDLGSNSTRLLVAGLYDQRVITLKSELRETRLGEKLRPGGCLFPPAMQRTLDALLYFFARLEYIKKETLAVSEEGLLLGVIRHNFL